ncbi:MAG: sigma-70 family RNA polymerase sigma factor [Candidatus Ozemobacteraceae bacterium]
MEHESSPPSDSQLVAEVLSGHREAFDAILVRHLSALQAYLRCLGTGPDQLDDLTQEVFLRAFRYLHSYQPARPFLGWILGIARNLWRDRKPNPVSVDPETLSQRPTEGPTVDEQTATGAEVEQLLSPLSDPDRLLIELRVFQDLPFAEIGELLAQTETHVRVRFHRVLARLRMIANEHRSLETHG